MIRIIRKITNKICLSLLICCMMMGLLLTNVSAINDTYSRVCIGNITLTPDTPYWKNGDSAATNNSQDYNVYWNTMTRELKLDNADIKGQVKANFDMFVCLQGKNKIIGMIGDDYYDYSITIQGSGSLNISNNSNHRVISTSNGTLTINSGTINVTGNSSAINMPLVVANHGIVINGGYLNSTNHGTNYAIDCYENGIITINGGHVFASSLNGRAFGKDVIVTKGYQYRDNVQETTTFKPADTVAQSLTGPYYEFILGDSLQTNVTFDMGGHGSNVVTEVISDATISQPNDPTTTGYEFVGWYKDNDYKEAWNFETDKVTSHTTLYAKWKKKEYNVTFHMNGHGEAVIVKADYDSLISKPVDPKAEGYQFVGWYRDSEDNAWDFEEYKVYRDTTLYAKWKKMKISYEIIKGQKSIWHKDDKADLVIVSNADYKDFIKVLVDSKEVDTKSYTVASGSTIVTLKASYLNTLSTGNHVFAIVSKDVHNEEVKAETTFEVKKEDKEISNQSTSTSQDKTEVSNQNKVVKTDDNHVGALWIMIFFMSCLGIRILRKKDNM